MAFFFFLSGYGLMESENRRHLSIKDFIVRRYWKVYRPLSLVNAAAYAVYLLVGYLAYDGPVQIIKAIFGVMYLDGVLWFVIVLFVCYAAFMTASQAQNRTLRNIVLSCSCALAIGIFVWLGYSYYWYVSIPMFAMGVMVSDYELLNPAKLGTRAIATALLAGTTLLMGIFLLKGGFIHMAINTAVVCTLIWILSYFTITLQKGPLLGSMSYEVYLTHNKVLALSVFLMGMISVWIYVPAILIIGGITYYLCNTPIKFRKKVS